MFKIEMVSRISAELVSVKVTMPAKEWNKINNDGKLGHLYGVDISNEVYQTTGVHAYNPIVSDTQRAKGGIKLIELTYADSVWVDNVIHVDFVTRRRKAA